MKVAIAGAGKVGRSIARELIANNHEVLLLDKNAAKAKQGAVSGAAVLVADACEISALDEAGLPSCQVVVAATGDDKVNLVVSLLAKTEYGVPRVVARVNHPKNEWLFDDSWGVDVAVDTTKFTLSSPVAATTTWQLGSPASSRAEISQASATRTAAPLTAPCFAFAAFLSRSSTS